jgi:phosphoribosylaminoimidazole-succinocarboxamide synthase
LNPPVHRAPPAIPLPPADTVDGRPIIVSPKDRRTGHQGIGTSGNDLSSIVGLDPAINFQADVAAGFVDDLAGLAQLVERGGDELLAAETGVDRHDEHQVDLVDDPVEHVQRRGRIEHQAGLAALFANQGQAAIDVPGRLGVKADHAGAGFREIGNDAVDRLDHQVHVDGRGDAVVTQCLAHHRADGEVGYVMVVHHIEMHPVRAGGEHGVHILAQTSEIGGQNGGGNHQRLLHDSIHTRIIGGWPILYPPTVSHYPIPPLQLLHQGKVRDIYAVDDERLLIVASDRLSAFDVILPDPIPGKGELLTRISNFWFGQFDDQVPNHLLDGDLAEILGDAEMARQLKSRSMLVRRLKPLPVEAIVRGYLAGSGWKDYQTTGAISGIALPDGLEQASPLPAPIFTPSTKADQGDHDENIDFAAMQERIGPELALRVRDISLAIYRRASAYARNRGIIIADTKFEFGTDAAGELYLIDEVLTPDSSRFWPVDEWRLGISPPSFDKQFVRDYLETLDWDKTPPGPELPPEIIEQTRQRYEEAAARLIG